MLWLTAPVLVEQMLHLLVQYVDFLLTGRILQSDSYLAAMTLMIYAAWFIANLFSLVGIGATALVARMVGAGDRVGANRVMHQALATGGLWAALLMAVGIPLIEQILRGMQLTGPAADAAALYLRYELAVLPAIMIEFVGIACLRGAGDTVTGLVVMAIVNVINACVSFSLAVGLGPLPAVGWEGLLIGTATGHICGALAIATLLVRGRAGFHLRIRELRPRLQIIRRILRVGIPGGVDTVGMIMCHLLFVRVINQLGQLASAAHGVAIQIEALAYMPGGAFQIAAATLAGQYLGATDVRRAKQSVGMACLVCGGLMVAAGMTFYLAATPIVMFFLGDRPTDVVPLAARLLRIDAVAIPPLGILMVLTGALRGAGDTRWPLVSTFVGLLLIRLPLSYYLALDSIDIPWLGVAIEGYGLGVAGAWYAVVVDVFARATLICCRFFHGGWTRIEV